MKQNVTDRTAVKRLARVLAPMALPCTYYSGASCPNVDIPTNSLLGAHTCYKKRETCWIKWATR